MKVLKRKYYDLVLNSDITTKIIFYDKKYLNKLHYDILIDIEYIHWYFDSKKLFLNLKIQNTNNQEKFIKFFTHKSLLNKLYVYENISIISDIQLVLPLLNICNNNFMYN